VQELEFSSSPPPPPRSPAKFPGRRLNICQEVRESLHERPVPHLENPYERPPPRPFFPPLSLFLAHAREFLRRNDVLRAERSFERVSRADAIFFDFSPFAFFHSPVTMLSARHTSLAVRPPGYVTVYRRVSPLFSKPALRISSCPFTPS